MRFRDEKFARNRVRYLFQCVLATLATFIVLLILDAANNTAVIAALGASSFISFTMPKTRLARPRFLIGGYLIGILSGVLSYHASQIPLLANASMLLHFSNALFGAIAVGLSIFLMVISDLEHPPAAGVALGLVLNNCAPKTIVVVFLGITSLALVKRLLRPFLIDLL